MKRREPLKPAAEQLAQPYGMSRSPTLRALAAWVGGDGLTWLYLFKTITAGLLALGIAMMLELPQPRIALTTVFVLMQPFSGMVLAKSFYRILGTAVGTVAALLLGACLVQQPELYLTAMIAWVSACIAAAVRYRHVRWYGFVLAGYTAALIGIPNVMAPHDLFIAALTRAAEVALGITCSSAVSALIMPRRSSLVLRQALQKRYTDFTAFASDVLRHGVERNRFEQRFADLVDEVVGFEATRVFAAFEEPQTRSRSLASGRLNIRFMDACARLHAINQLLKRLREKQATPAFAAIEPFLAEVASSLSATSQRNAAAPQTVAAGLRRFHGNFLLRVRETRDRFETGLAPVPAETATEFDTAAELLYRFVAEWIRYSDLHALLATSPTEQSGMAEIPRKARQSHKRLKRHAVRIARKATHLITALTFIRSALTMALTACFWIATNWPSGGLALIGSALACALTSMAPNPPKMAAHMAAGAIFATVTGYLFTCYVYPNIDGFPLLCMMLAPVLAFGAFIATRKQAAGLGVGFSVFFCLLAGPDNATTYAPELLINNGIALTVSMLLATLVLASALPTDAPWLVKRLMAGLRAQVVSACNDDLHRLNQHFHSDTYDLAFQLRVLLTRRSHRRRHALRWMLVTLEVGHAVIDLRHEAERAHYAAVLHPDWRVALTRVQDEIARLFRLPDKTTTESALDAVHSATCVANEILMIVHADSERHRDLQRLMSCLHFIRTALLDKDAPFNHG